MEGDLERQIKAALSDPDIMQKVSGVLSGLGDGDKSSGALPGPLAAASKAVEDDRTRLLMALKPFLSEKRAPYMESAVNILRLVSIGKIGKELNLF